VIVRDIEWSGKSDYKVLSDVLKEGSPFKISCAQLRLDPKKLMTTCQKFDSSDTTKYSSVRGTALSLTITETFSSKRDDNTNRIEYGQRSEADKNKTVSVEVYQMCVTFETVFPVWVLLVYVPWVSFVQLYL
jgi:hypothetical protein